jgi:hypothetical protein
MQIMGCRFDDLTNTLEGLDRGAVPLVGFKDGAYYPIGRGDDLGSYYFIPEIAQRFDLPLQTAIDVFYYGSVAIASIIGVIGLLCYFRCWTARAVSLGLLAVSVKSIISSGTDVYLAPACCIVACVPWSLWLAERAQRLTILLSGGLLLGFAIQTASLVRGHGGTGVMLFTLIAVCLAARHTVLRRVGFVVALMVGIAVPQLYKAHLLRESDAYLREHRAGYTGRVSDAHPLWHSIYIGLGYLKNSYGIDYNDTVAYQAAAQIVPGIVYMSSEYDRVLRERVFAIYDKDPTFIFQTLSAKAGYVCFCILTDAHFGLIAACLGVLSWRLLAAFACGIAFSALPGILVMPSSQYLFGLHTFSSLFAVVSIAQSCDHRWTISARARSWLTERLWNRLPSARRFVLPTAQAALIIISLCVVANKSAASYRFVAGSLEASRRDSMRQTIKFLAASDRLDDARKFTLADLKWTTTSPKAEVARSDDEIKLKTGGDRYDFQLESKIPITEEAVYATYELDIEEGGVAIGILNESGLWTDVTYCLKPGKHHGKLAAHIEGNRDIRLIVFNYNQTGSNVDVASKCRIKNFNVVVGNYDSVATMTAGSDGDGKLRR